MIDFRERIKFNGNFSALLTRIASDYQLGSVESYDIVEYGFEDLNVHLLTASSDVLVKIYSKNRTRSEIERNADILGAVRGADIAHPVICLSQNGELLHTDRKSDLKMVVMEYIHGKTLYQLGAVPDDSQLKNIAEQAFKINSLNYQPEYVFDSWAIPNFMQAYEKNYKHINDNAKYLIDQVKDRFESIPFDDLPKSFVHGDLIKPNIIIGANGNIYIVDFSVANTYPRIQEIAVMAQSLLASSNAEPLRSRVEKVKGLYESYADKLSELEDLHILNYALVGAAMEYLGSVGDRIESGRSDEADHYEMLALETLKNELSLV